MTQYPFIPHQVPGAVLLFRNVQGHVFLQFRDEKAPVAPLQFALWGGAIDPGETPEEAAAREMFEELSLQHVLYPLGRRHCMRVESERGVLDTYLFEVDKPVAWNNVRIQEGAGGVFVPFEAALNLDLAPMPAAWFRYLQSV